MRILATFALAFSAGIFLSVYFLDPGILLPGCLICMLAALMFRMIRGDARLVLGALGLCTALGYHAFYLSAVYQPMLAMAGTEQTLTMTLCDYAEETSWGARVNVRIPEHPLGKIMYYGDESLLELSPGQTVTDEVSLQNAAYIREYEITSFTSKGIFLTAYSQGEAQIGTGESGSWKYFPLRCGWYFSRIVFRQMSGDTAGFLVALLTGDSTALSEQRKDTLSEAGLYHVLAVSGMHCGYLLALAMLLIGRHRQRLLAIVTIGILVFYVLLTGGSPSVLRACVMLTFVLLAPVFRRESDGLTNLSAALFLILLANPFSAASLSLQLSFGAMAGILWLPGRIWGAVFGEGRRSGAVARFVVSSFAATLGALVFTLPLTAFYFGELMLISPLSNLLCLWAAGFAFCTGLISVAAGAVVPAVGQILSWIPELLIRYILWAAEILSHIPYHDISFVNPYLKYWLIGAYLLFFLMWKLGPEGRKKYAAAAVFSLLALVITVKAGYLRYQSGLDAVILDVGQGQCIVLKSGDDFAVIDCGSSWADAAESASQQLQAMGCSSLDYLILTHYDNDHVSGAESLLNRERPEYLLVSPDAEDAGVQKTILSAAEAVGTEVIDIYNRRSLVFGNGEIVIYPPVGKKTDNERGISVLAASGEDSLFITGDMSQETEKLLMKTYALAEADVLVVGHHGAKNATSERLLDVLNPKVACISVGSNQYGHPHADTLERLSQQGCTIYRTDMDGDIHLALNP